MTKSVFRNILLSASLLLSSAMPAQVCLGETYQEEDASYTEYQENEVSYPDYYGEYGVQIEDIHSWNALLVNADTHTVVASRHGDELVYPASITKLMTALVVCDHLDPDTMVTLSASCIDRVVSEDGSTSGFHPDETLPVRDLLAGALLPSGGDCCLCLAEAVSGSEADFAWLMNEKAAEFGMINTHFVNTSGLPDEDHYSTLQDLAVLMEMALKHPIVGEIITSPTYTSIRTDAHPDGMVLSNTIFSFLAGADVQNGRILGGKTGYTDDAGQCLASAAQIGDTVYILVTTNAGADETGTHYNVTDAVDIYDRYAGMETQG